MSQSESHKFQTTVMALESFYPAPKTEAQSTLVPKKRKKLRKVGSSNTSISLELIRNLSTDFKSLHQLAAEGDLENLKSFIETYGVTIKELDENQATLLHHASATNQVSVMRYLIDSGIHLEATDKDGHTALHIAVLQGHVEATDLLLESGINDKILNKSMDAALHIAVRSNNLNIIAAFLEHPNIELVVTGYRRRTPLHIISEYDNVEACALIHNSVLVKEHFKNKGGFRICAADEDDITPIHLAARMGSHKVLDLCMTNCKLHGYPPEVVLGFIDEENSTPLHAAIDGGHAKVVEVLLKHGADPMVQKDSQVPPFLLACSQGKLEMIEIILGCENKKVIFCQDVYGKSCLHHCTHAINSSHIISYLVSKGAQVDSLDNKGKTPLMVAIIAGSTSGVIALLKLGANVLIKDSEGNSALHYAVIRNRRKIANILLELPGAATLVVDTDNKQNSPIHHALKLGHCALINPMIAVIRCKLRNVKDCNGNNYLHLAVNGGNPKALSSLLEIPESVKLLNETNNYGGTPLHTAAWGGQSRCLEILLSYGAMIHRCHYGMTPFMVACAKGNAEAAQILFTAHPFQLNWMDDKGQNPLHFGASSGNPQIITLLLDIGIPVVHNFEQESFFDNLIKKNDIKCAAAVIEHDRYQECLDLVSPIHPHPMIQLVMHMPEIAKKVLDRSHTKASLARINPDYWEKFDFKYLRLPKCFSKARGAYDDDEEGEKQQPLLAPDEKEGMQIHNVIRYKGSIKTTSPLGDLRQKWSQEKTAHLKTLQTMVKFNRSSLLTHPVSNAYLKSKWRSYGRWTHLMLSSITIFQVLFLFLFTALIPNPSDIQANSASANASANCADGTNGTTRCLEFGYGANICRFASLVFAFLNFVVWIIIVAQLRLKAINILKNSFIFVDAMSFAFTVFYLLPTRGLNNANWEAGAVGVFFAWFSLVLKIQLFDLFGVYITMFLAITRRVFQVLLVCFLFVISFGLSFYIMTGNLTQYSTIGYSIFVNFGHLLGEIDYQSFVEEDVAENLQFGWLTFMFVVTLALLMGIVIMNLLIGLAVGDIDEIRSNAISEKKFIEVDFFSQLDIILPSRLIFHLDKQFVIKHPNQDVFIIRHLWHYFWQTLKGEDPNLNDSDESQSDISSTADQRAKEVVDLRERISDLHITQESILTQLGQMKEMQEAMMKLIMASSEREEENTATESELD